MTWTILQRSEINASLTAWRGGQGPHLVLIHGVGLSADAWQSMAEDLSRAFTVTAIDLPGHGGSKYRATSHTPTLSDFVSPLADYLNNLEAPVLLIGHSLGALITLELAISKTPNVVGIVTLNAIFRRSKTAEKAVKARAAELANSAQVDSTTTLVRWFGEAPEGVDAKARDACATMLNATEQDAYAAGYFVFAHSDGPSDEALSQCDVPMLFITGADEPNSTPTMSEAMATLAPKGAFQIVPNARHMIPMTHADEVNQHIRKFAQAIGHTHDPA